MTRDRAARSGPIDISAVARTDALLDALSSRRVTDPALTSSHVDDPAVRLLTALIGDVDSGAPPLPAPAKVRQARSAQSRSVVRAFVGFGVTAVALTVAGAAAAGSGTAHQPARLHAGPRGAQERSNRSTPLGHIGPEVAPADRLAANIRPDATTARRNGVHRSPVFGAPSPWAARRPGGTDTGLSRTRPRIRVVGPPITPYRDAFGRNSTDLGGSSVPRAGSGTGTSGRPTTSHDPYATHRHPRPGTTSPRPRNGPR